MWVVVFLTGRRSEAERVTHLLQREGFLAELRGDGPYEIVVPKGEAKEAQEVIQRG